MAAKKSVEKRGRKPINGIAMTKRLPLVRISAAEDEALEAAAKAGGRTKHGQVRWILFPPK